jgi:LytS/YehU family sensor histidine kinase
MIAYYLLQICLIFLSQYIFSKLFNKGTLSIYILLLFKLVGGGFVYFLASKVLIFFYESPLLIVEVLFFLATFSFIETISLSNNIMRNRLYMNNLKIAKEHAEIESLNLQVDAHFLFNSLNTLNYIFQSNPSKSKLFIQKLAEVYRYVLVNKSSEYVKVKDELSFSQNYLELLKERFGETLNYKIEITDLEAEEFKILPISIQLLIENAVKHNKLTKSTPLNLVITIYKDKINVVNSKNILKGNSNSLNLGLINLNDRFEIISGKKIQINNTESSFIVTLPITP